MMLLGANQAMRKATGSHTGIQELGTCPERMGGGSRLATNTPMNNRETRDSGSGIDRSLNVKKLQLKGHWLLARKAFSFEKTVNVAIKANYSMPA